MGIFEFICIWLGCGLLSVIIEILVVIHYAKLMETSFIRELSIVYIIAALFLGPIGVICIFFDR